MTLPSELSNIFKFRQKTYKMVLILSLLDEISTQVNILVPISTIKKRFLSYYQERELSGLIIEKPPGNTKWNNVTDGQLNMIIQNPLDALNNILLQVDDSIGFRPDIWEEMKSEKIEELRQYALREIEIFYNNYGLIIPLHDYLHRILSTYLHAKTEPLSNHLIGELIRKTIPEELKKILIPDDLQDYKVQGSIGQGNWAAVPWIAIMHKDITNSTQHGEYIVYLFAEDMTAVYLTLAQGVTVPLRERGKKLGYEYLRNKVEEIRNLIPLRGFTKDDKIYLKDKGLGEDYQVSTIAYKRYEVNNLPSDHELVEDLRNMLENYEQYIKIATKKEFIENISSSRPQFKYTIAHFYYGHGILHFLIQQGGNQSTIDELVQNQYQVLKAGEEVKYPRERTNHLARAMNDMKFLEMNGDILKLTPIGARYAAAFDEDYWGLTETQQDMIRNHINSVQNTSELIKILRISIQIAKKLNIFNKDEFQPEFLGAMNVDNWNEVTRTNRSQFMLNWLQDLGYLTKTDQLFQFVQKKEQFVMNDMLTVTERIDSIKSYITQKGFHYPDHLIENFYLSLRTKPFVILAGISGTGKTKLVQLFAEAIGATEGNDRFTLIPVRPDWSDPSDLLGYQDLSGQFRTGRLTDSLIEASKPSNRNKPYFICLDEMNLARVEHYFSDILSIMETKRRVGDRIITDAVLSQDTISELESLIIPDNVYIIGTVNMDETTHPFSKKVLDRANTIEFNYINLERLPEITVESESIVYEAPNTFLHAQYLQLIELYPEYEDLVKRTTEKLVQVNSILEEIHANIGFRVRDNICFYMVYNERFGLLPQDDAFDLQLIQKILPRLIGSSISLKRTLIRLMLLATNQKGNIESLIDDATTLYIPWRMSNQTPSALYPQSARKLAYMLRRLEEDGFTSFWLS